LTIRLATPETSSRYHHYESLVSRPEFEWLGTIEAPYAEALYGVDALIISCDQFADTRLAILASRKLGIPVFHIIDGVVDWRTTFTDPQYQMDHGGIQLFQPMLADHVFAMGPLQKYLLHWLGNKNIHASGLPRLDVLPRRACRKGPCGNTPTLLVATANTPSSTENQMEILLESLASLLSALSATSKEGKHTIQYRVSQRIEDTLGVTGNGGESAEEALSKADALITTPSTLAIEAMLMGVPTLIFDPFALPTLTPSAWYATHWSSVMSSLDSLLAPSDDYAELQDLMVGMTITPGVVSSKEISNVIQQVISAPGFDDSSSGDFTKSSTRISEVDFTEAQLASFMASIPKLESRIGNLKSQIRDFEELHENPGLRFAATMLMRAFRRRSTQ
jgi:hypothetical protein